jgi:hypothetical protein
VEPEAEKCWKKSSMNRAAEWKMIKKTSGQVAD